MLKDVVAVLLVVGGVVVAGAQTDDGHPARLVETDASPAPLLASIGLDTSLAGLPLACAVEAFKERNESPHPVRLVAHRRTPKRAVAHHVATPEPALGGWLESSGEASGF